MLRFEYGIDEGAPVGHVRHRRGQVQGLDDGVSESFVLKEHRDLIDGEGGLGSDDALAPHVAEEGDLVLDVIGHGLFAAADDCIGLDAAAAEIPDAVLGGLGLELAGRGNVREVGDVDVKDVVTAGVVAHLADRLEEWLALDVADRPADLDDYHFGPTLFGEVEHALLDGVGDVRDDLNRAAQELTLALASDDITVNLPGGDVG